MRTVFRPLGGPKPRGLKEKCALCRRVMPNYALRRCFRCKRLVCTSCITEDLMEHIYLICLTCARKAVTSKTKFRGKYTPLTFYLSQKANWTKRVNLQFSRIEGIIGSALPISALTKSEWWDNTETTRQGQAWLNVSWNVENVDFQEKSVTFTRPTIVGPTTKPRRKRSPTRLPAYRPKKITPPSLTKIARAQARLHNVSRRKNSFRQYRGKFNPRSAYEKRTFQFHTEPD